MCGFSAHNETLFQKTIQIEPRHSRAHNNIGHIYMLQGKFDTALKEYKRAVDTNPHNIEAIAPQEYSIQVNE